MNFLQYDTYVSYGVFDVIFIDKSMWINRKIFI